MRIARACFVELRPSAQLERVGPLLFVIVSGWLALPGDAASQAPRRANGLRRHQNRNTLFLAG